MGFGTAAAVIALVVATLLVWAAGAMAGVWLFLLVFGIPATLLIGAAAHSLGRGLVLVGLLPAAGIAGAAFWLADAPGGLEGTLRSLAQHGLRRLDMAGSAPFVAEIVRVKAAAIGFWMALALLANAWVAGRLLAKAGIGPAPDWAGARLPAWYGVLPALALGFWLAADDGSDAVELSLLLVLLAPLMLHALAALHTRTRGLGARPFLLGVVYVSLVILFLPAALALAGFGAYDLITRRPSNHTPSNTGGGRAAPPPRS
jgi:hypothetical protein